MVWWLGCDLRPKRTAPHHQSEVTCCTHRIDLVAAVGNQAKNTNETIRSRVYSVPEKTCVSAYSILELSELEGQSI